MRRPCTECAVDSPPGATNDFGTDTKRAFLSTFDASLGKPGAGFAVKNEKDANMLYPYDRAPVRLEGKLTNLDTAQKEDVSLVPMGSGLAILRRLTFPVATATESQRQSLISKAKAVEK